MIVLDMMIILRIGTTLTRIVLNVLNILRTWLSFFLYKWIVLFWRVIFFFFEFCQFLSIFITFFELWKSDICHFLILHSILYFQKFLPMIFQNALPKFDSHNGPCINFSNQRSFDFYLFVHSISRKNIAARLQLKKYIYFTRQNTVFSKEKKRKENSQSFPCWLLPLSSDIFLETLIRERWIFQLLHSPYTTPLYLSILRQVNFLLIKSQNTRMNLIWSEFLFYCSE